jgi:hypothetical protein
MPCSRSWASSKIKRCAKGSCTNPFRVGRLEVIDQGGEVKSGVYIYQKMEMVTVALKVDQSASPGLTDFGEGFLQALENFPSDLTAILVS